MKYFLDTEFLEGPQKRLIGHTKPTIDLISIAIVDETGKEFYAVSREFNLKEAWNRWQPRTGQGDRNNHELREYWIRENVLRPIFDEFLAKYKSYYSYLPISDEFCYRTMKFLLKEFGDDQWYLALKVKNFINDAVFAKKDVDFYGYYADYDWVVFCWLFGTMMKLPEGFPWYCRDLKQIMAEKASSYKGWWMKNAKTPKERLEMLQNHPKYPKQTNEHNALANARWNLELYKFLQLIP